MEAAGLAVGVVSLAFELFSSCLKAYNLILEANDMPKTCSYLLVRLQMEKEKLLGWAVLARISDDDISVSSGIKLNKHAVIDTLREVHVLLHDFSQLDVAGKLNLVVSAEASNQSVDAYVTTLRPDFSSLQKKSMRFIEKTRKYPKRLRWAAFDKAGFENLLSKLEKLNATMMDFLEAYDRKRHFQMQEATFMQILQVNNRLGDLHQLVHSLKLSGSTPVECSDKHDTDHWNSFEERLLKLTQFKGLAIEIESDESSNEDESANTFVSDTSKNSANTIEDLTELSSEVGDQPARSFGALRRTPVWVEWRYYEETDENEGPPPFIAQRITKMAKLLGAENKPTEFLVPRCLGYVHDEEQYRFGFVFQSLETSQAGLPASLFDLLQNVRKPSLTTRISIARKVATSIWYLHATNWLHKGLRSENIIFQDRSDIKGTGPFLCGFDYSRPALLDEETERPQDNLIYDLYRHPNVQFDVPRDGRKGFNKLHDVYSLGVVLYEIGAWRPIQRVLGIDVLRASIVRNVKTQLLSHDMLDFLCAEAGCVMASVAKTCLDGSLVSDETMVAVDSDARLQLNFGEQIVQKLERIDV